ncbi:P44/Msp2 family outer membrane protein [Wolbachia endosymbiont (group E) of Neria commutata]|uniref:P44/Msp2 family outer membrane protein n=1 Tax=Wolbachia endosymbiont (group E) of Neria commutata TaxID=3066149 RepID=UPI0031334A9B
MQYKKFFSAAALVTLLSLSNYVSADPMGSEDENTSYYVRGQYNVEYFNMMSGKELKSDHATSGTFIPLFSYKKVEGTNNENFYKPSYKTTFITGSAAAGLKMEDNIGVELEVLYSQLDVDGAGYKDTNSADKPDNAKVFAKVTAFDGSDSGKATGTNEGFKTIAAMVNAYYHVDLGNESIPVTPYVGAGVGVAKVNFAGADHWKPAYQAKAGISYAVTSEIKVYGGYRYFGLYGNEFKDAILKHTTSGTTTETKINLQQEVMYGVHGVEAGVMFHF